MAHLIMYGSTNVLFLIINLAYGRSQIWFFYPLIIWGLFVGLHYWLLKLYIKGRLNKITMLNFTRNVFNATGNQATIYVENLGSSYEHLISASNNFTISVSSTYSGTQGNCTLPDLIENLSQAQKDERQKHRSYQKESNCHD